MNDLKKIYLIRRFNAGKFTTDGTNDLVSAIARKIFIPIEDTDIDPVPSDMPVLKFGAMDLTKELIRLGKVTRQQLYSDPRLVHGASNKRNLYDLMGPSYMPKTVFDISDIDELGDGLIVCKPEAGQGGRGIYKVRNANEIPDRGGYLYQEFIHIAAEYRCLMVGNKMIFMAERVPANGKTKSMRSSDSNHAMAAERNVFEWKKIYISPLLEGHGGFLSLCQDVMSKSKLKFAGIDVALDQDGRTRLIEVNTTPGLNHDQMTLAYENIFQHYYGRPVDDSTAVMLKELGETIIQTRNIIRSK
jgi:hypothetical protein